MPTSPAFGVYLSMRHLPLLRASGEDYERTLCIIVIKAIEELLAKSKIEASFSPKPNVGEMQQAIAQLSAILGKRIVLFFDDAAHIGREASLAKFFDMFRTLSSSTVSCKATIYPGVTQFGERFDIYNDATVVDIVRNEEQTDFEPLFAEILAARWPALSQRRFNAPLTMQNVAGFLAQSVVGNMRGFIFACNELDEKTAGNAPGDGAGVGLRALEETLTWLATNYYWPLFDEVEPKLGKYVPLVQPARAIAETVFRDGGKKSSRSILVHRDIVSRLSKVFEILEYVGFISRREASRAMRSGGRGARYSLNLCNLLDETPGRRLSNERFAKWHQRTVATSSDYVEYQAHKSELSGIDMPSLAVDGDLKIFEASIAELAQSRTYPYGLTTQKIALLTAAGIITVGALAGASDEQLLAIDTVGVRTVERFRNVVAQAIWM